MRFVYNLDSDPMQDCPKVGTPESMEAVEKLLTDNLLFYGTKNSPVSFTIRKYPEELFPYICTIEDMSVLSLFNGHYAQLHIRGASVEELFTRIPLSIVEFVVINIEALAQAHAARDAALVDMANDDKGLVA